MSANKTLQYARECIQQLIQPSSSSPSKPITHSSKVFYYPEPTTHAVCINCKSRGPIHWMYDNHARAYLPICRKCYIT